MGQLTVPIHDRRTHRRILTLKSVGGTALAVTLLFAAVTIRSEMRHPNGTGYGRLFGTQVRNEQEVGKPKYDVVKEGPVPDQTAADPTLLAPSARAQALGIGLNPMATPTIPASTGTLVEVDGANTGFVSPQPVLQGQGGVTIVGGGAGGVTIVRTNDRSRPTLGGGIFKQP